MADQVYTNQVADQAGPKANARAKVVFASLIRHLHEFCREVDLTNEEWLMACDSLVTAGQISSADRNEMILISDVLGIESLVDSMAQERYQKFLQPKNVPTLADESAADMTLSAILGPFYREGLPSYKNGDSIVLTHAPEDISSHLFGTVKDTRGTPIPGAHVDIWHTGSHGFYDSQVYDPKDPTSLKFNWRGRFTTDEKGRYDVNCLRPTAYPIPNDCVAGHILTALDRSAMRPAHIHIYVQAKGYMPLVTQIYDTECEHVQSDAVFGVKDSLIVKFKEIGEKKTELEYNIVIAKALQKVD